MRGKFLRLFTLAMALLLIATGAGSQLLAYDIANSDDIAVDLASDETINQAAADVESSASGAPVHEVSQTGRYIIQLADPAVPSYTGDIAGLAATSPQVTGERRLDASSPAVQAYSAYLQGKQDEFIADMEQALGRSIEVVFRYDGAMNGLAAVVSHEEALQLSRLAGVKAIFGETERELDTDIGPWLLGAPSIWVGDTGSGVATRGEGVIVGVIDTGVNFQHLSFAAVDGDGYAHTNPYGAGNYRGWCIANPGDCNDKLVGAYGLNPLGGNPADDHGHGSHTGSTAAGNIHDAVFVVGSDTFTRTIAGMAPRANVVAYKVCTPGCPSGASVQAVNHAIMDDEVDVLNYSISGVDNPWLDSVDLAFLEAFNAGIFVAASAGNAGPGASTVAKTGPWNASVAASTHSRVIANTVDATAPVPVPPELEGMAAVPGTGPAILADIEDDIVWAGDLGNVRACTAGGGLPGGSMAGSIGLIQRGDCTFAEKVNNAVSAGAIAVIVYNHVGGPPITMGGLEPTAVPAVFIDQNGGDALAAFVSGATDPMARINEATSLIINNDWNDFIAGFSSRGPSQFEMLAPTFAAPGVNTLAAGAFGATHYYFSQGTSMASPHAAGAGALMMALNPTWSPAEVRSALAMTANPEMVKEDGVTPADPFDMGSGRLNVAAAGHIGLVLDETYANFVNANPAIGGDPKTLNLPAFVNYNCTEECSWTRTVTSVAQDTVTYNAVADAPAGMVITVDPPSFTIDPGESQELVITVDVAGSPLGSFAFAEIRLVPQGGSIAAPAAELLNESFTDTLFPPAGWAKYKLQGVGAQEWERVTAQFSSPPASAHRRWSGSADGFQDEWLVTPPLAFGADGASLTYIDAGQWMNDYGYSGVWVSTDSCDPADDDFVEVAEMENIPGAGTSTVVWRSAPVSLDLSTYANETVCLAFRYSGTFAHSWWIDNVVVAEPTEPSDVATVHLPVAVIPALNVPIITVDPDEMSATQAPDEVTTQTLTIGNAGGVDLEWTITEEPVAIRLGLELDGSPDATLNQSPESTPMSFILDDGIGENAVGLTGGAQFLWLNRFTPNFFNFPITIDTVDVMFGYPGSTGNINVGELVDIYLYEDADGNPANGATHRASLHDQAVQAVNGTTWSSYTLNTPVTFDGPGDILIAVVNRTAGVTPSTFPAVIDQTPPSHQRSWIGFGAVPGDPPVLPMPTFAIIDSFGLAGNWMVRGFGTGNVACDNPADVPWLDADPDMGTTSPGSSSDVTVTFDSTGLAIGDYHAFLCVNSNDLANPLVVVPVTLVVGVPAIMVEPTSLESSQATGSVTTQPLAISNVGQATLVWNIDEAQPVATITGGTARTIPDSLPDPATLQRDYLLAPLADVIVDGGFELGTPNPAWDEGSTNFGTPLCTAASCGLGGGTGPHSGSWWAWFGGISAVETGFVRQAVTLAVGTAELSFWLEIPAASGTGNDFMTVSLGGDVIFDVTDADAASYATYQLVVLDVSAYADGGTHLLSFDSTIFGGGTTNFFVDDVALDNEPVTGACDTPTDVLWLSVSPDSGSTPAGATSDVTVTFDSTGLVAGVYEALLCIESNDPVMPLVEVPVTLEVTGEVPAIAVDPASLEASQAAGTVTAQLLGISNVGEGLLEWDIDEAGPMPGSNLAVLYDNGPLVTHPGAGPGGSDHSTVQNVSLGMTLLGSNVGLPGGYRIADDFTVSDAGGWTVDTITFYAYQTGSPTTSTFTHVNYRIWDGPPDDPGSTIVFGDTTTNRLVSTDWTNAYRVSETTVNTQRPIMDIVASGGFHLPAGSYWVDWQLNGTIASGPWQPPITIIGQTTTGNAKQFASGAWQAMEDGGTFTAQGAPFTIEGSLAEPDPCDVPTDVPWLSVSPTSGSTPAGATSDVTVMFDSTGLVVGLYEALLCVNSNDPVQPLVTVPVTLNVVETIYDVMVTPPTDAKSGTVGTVVTYDLQVTNAGNAPDTFALSYDDNIWGVALSAMSTGELQPGASFDLSVMVSVPAGANAGDMDSVVVTATSQGDNTVSDSSTLTTTALAVEPPDYGVTLTPATAAATGRPGTTVTYLLTLTNVGGVEDTFMLTATGWATLPVSSFTLASGASTTVVVHVNIPAGAADGATNLAIVTAVSSGDPSQMATSQLTTTVEWYRIFMPVIMKT